MKKVAIAPVVSGTKIISVFVLMVLIVSFGCRSKTVVKKLSNTNSKTETTKIKGAMYHLPLTVIQVSVPFKIKKETPGEFSDFTPCFFNESLADQRIKEEKKSVSLDKPTFTPTGIADLKETYVVQTTGRYFESRTIAMTKNKDGVLTEGSFEIKDQTLPTAIKIAETAIGIGAKLVPFLGEEDDFGAKALEKLINESTTGEKPPDCYSQGFLFQIKKAERNTAKLLKELKSDVRESEIRNFIDSTNNNKIAEFVSQSPAIAGAEKTKEIVKNLEKLEKERIFWKEKFATAAFAINEVTNKEIADRNYLPFVVSFRNAQLANAELRGLISNRDSLQGDLQNIDAELYKVRIKELDDSIKELTGKFFGTEKTTPWTGNFEFNPAKNQNGIDHQLLLVYSKSNGICYDGTFKDRLAKDGIIPDKDLRFGKCTGANDLTKVQVYADRQDADAAFVSQVTNAKLLMQNQTSGWYFRIPAKATVALIECKNTEGDTRCLNDTTEFGREKMLIAQYGEVVSLPAQTAGRSSNMSVVLDETTGALKNFKASSSPLIDQATIESAGKTVEKVIDASDPLTKKKRELELLETQNKINTEREKLENPSPTPAP